MSNDQEEFSKLTTKFLFLNCNDGKSKNSKSDLNNLLNDLNSLEYQAQQFVDQKSALRLIDSFSNISANEETLIVKACCVITSLVNKQKLRVQTPTLRTAVKWLLKCLNLNFPDIACDILTTLQVLFKNHPEQLTEFRESLLLPDGPLFSLLTNSSKEKQKQNYDGNSSAEIAKATMFCIEAVIPLKDDVDIPEHIVDLLNNAGATIINIVYSPRITFDNPTHFCLFATPALSALQKIATLDRDWLDKNLGEIIGIAKSYMLYGLPGIPQTKPQKVIVSQQSVFEPVSSQTSKGGKVAKTRKPRAVTKNKKNDARNKTPRAEDAARTNSLKVDYDSAILSPFNKTSDSDFSETETGRTQSEMHKQSKLRMTALSLIGLIAKNIEKKIIYGYWHSLFPSEPLTITTKSLLNCVLRDPNPRCRIAALQAASMFLFNSKPYLSQAESRKAPSSFMPFSISLGNMVLAIYEALTQALSAESSLPVLTQILKCLTVLIQATPFHRLDNSFIPLFVKYIRHLVYHKDPTIQVAALMVMEFLISVQDITKEISECIGIPKNKLNTINKNQNQLNDVSANDLIDIDDEEIIDSDSEEDIPDIQEDNKPSNATNSNRMSWLLQKVIENLGVAVGEFKKTTTPSTTPVRIECLQVLACIAPHFLLLKDHLELIGMALNISLNDSQPEIRLYAGKTLDTIGHSMSSYLLENARNDTDELVACQNFWTLILPTVIQKIQDQTQSSALKVSLCDCMSNIGVHIFERLPRASHIQLMSLLSGASCNEENIVRAAAVRALAVYVLYPSLRDDLCFVENIAECIIQLLNDANLYVRVKASWSMGNVSDALVADYVDSQMDKISNDLLKRMLQVSIESAGDNDKVRSNAVRTLGNLLRLLTVAHLKSPDWQKIFKNAIEKLGQNLNTGGNAKVKWNTCYAIGNFMRNEALFTSKEFDWQTLIFTSLTNVVINNTNFKVRINSAAALAIVGKREYYGMHLTLIWSSLLSALEQSDNLSDFNEYKHRDNLQEQICLTLSHIIKIASIDDYAMLKNELIPKLESVTKTWVRVVNRVLPENAAPLLSCSIELKKSLKQSDLQTDLRKSIQILASCFVPPNSDYF